MIFTKKMLLMLIIPLIIEQTLAVAVGMADVMMVSQAGEAAVSGVSLVDMINVLLINVFAALATGGAVVIAQLLGAKKHEEACKSASHLMSISFVLSLFITLVVLLFKVQLLRLFFGSIESDVMEACLVYLTISAISYPFLALYNSSAAIFRSVGNSKISMFTSLMMNLINVTFNAIFVFGLKMGVSGVAYASLISRGVAAIVMLILCSNKNNLVHIEFVDLIRLRIFSLKRILKIGLPSACENAMFQLGRIIVVSIISIFGTVQIAANAVANNFDSLGTIPGSALNLAMITVIGQCVGANKLDQAKYYVRKLMKYAYLVTIILNVVIIASLPITLNLYNISPEARNLTIILVLIHDGFACLLWPLSFTLPNALRACNDVKYTMIVAVASMWICRLVGSYIFGIVFNLGAIGVWIAMVLDWCVRVIFFGIRYHGIKWQKCFMKEDASLTLR